MSRPFPYSFVRNRGFTLLEILAVVAIFALIAGIAMPNFQSLQTRNVKHNVNRLVGQLELARQRAIVTGVQHRLYIDIDAGTYNIEWLGNGAELEGDEEFAGGDTGSEAGAAGGSEDEFGAYGAPPLDLSAPEAAEASFVAVTGDTGREIRLDDGIFFAGIETAGGWSDEGETYIRFERDGSADATTIEIGHESGLGATLDVLPLADTIRVAYVTP